jgi:hypothetical protein
MKIEAVGLMVSDSKRFLCKWFHALPNLADAPRKNVDRRLALEASLLPRRGGFHLRQGLC